MIKDEFLVSRQLSMTIFDEPLNRLHALTDNIRVIALVDPSIFCERARNYLLYVCI